VQNRYFVQFFSTNFIIEQNWWLFCRALLHLKVNYVFRIPKFWVLIVPPIQIPNIECYFELLSVQYDESIHAPDERFLNKFQNFKTPSNEYLTNFKLSPKTPRAYFSINSYALGLLVLGVANKRVSRRFHHMTDGNFLLYQTCF
jgi:hypothetical protein